MYFKKIRPRTTCLYSAGSMLLRILSAAAHKDCSNPMLAAVLPLAIDWSLLVVCAGVEPLRALRRAHCYQLRASGLFSSLRLEINCAPVP